VLEAIEMLGKTDRFPREARVKKCSLNIVRKSALTPNFEKNVL
jgi:hypothetical protein